MTYLPDNQGEASMHENSRFLTLKMDSLAKKKYSSHVYFSVQYLLSDPPIERGKADKSCLDEEWIWQQLISLRI